MGKAGGSEVVVGLPSSVAAQEPTSTHITRKECRKAREEEEVRLEAEQEEGLVQVLEEELLAWALK